MRILFLILAAILSFSNVVLLSQDLIDPPKLTQLETTTVIDRSINHFIRAWNWGGPGAMLDSAMFINTYHGFIFDSDDYLEDTHLMTRPDSCYARLIGGRAKDFVFNAHCLYLEPTLEINTTQEFTPVSWNKSGAVFGFQYKNSTGMIDTNENGNFKLLAENYNPDSSKVLSNIWKNDCLRWLDYDGGDKGGDSLERTNHDTLNSDIDRKTYYVGANGSERTPLQAQAMQFDARLKIDPTKDFNFLENDNLQSIFGFQNVRGRREGEYQIFDKNANIFEIKFNLMCFYIYRNVNLLKNICIFK